MQEASEGGREGGREGREEGGREEGGRREGGGREGALTDDAPAWCLGLPPQCPGEAPPLVLHEYYTHFMWSVGKRLFRRAVGQRPDRGQNAHHK